MPQSDTEIWEAACERVGIEARHCGLCGIIVHSKCPPIGDPACVVAMLEWLAGHNLRRGYNNDVTIRRYYPDAWTVNSISPWFKTLPLALAEAVNTIPVEKSK